MLSLSKHGREYQPLAAAGLILVLFALGGCATRTTVQAPKDWNIGKYHVLGALIAHVKIYHVPEDLETFSAIRPSEVEKNAYEIVEFRDAKRAGSLLQTLHESVGAPIATTPDLRWKLLFEDDRGRELLSAYVGRFSDQGIIDGHNYGLKADVAIWLNDHLGSSLVR